MNKFFFAICMLQLALILILASYQVLVSIEYIPENEYVNQNSAVIFLMLMTAVTIYMMILQLLRDSRSQIKTRAQTETIENIQALNLQLRAQRHDFLNHIQIVYGMIEMDEYDEAKKYLQRIYGALETVTKTARTGDVAINALLQAKCNSAERRDIQMQIDVAASLRGLLVPSLDICRILSNIIDNGLYSAEKFDGEKKLSVVLSENISHYVFKIANTGETIPAENMKKIFRAGFTTKGGSGEGMGLYITKSIVAKYGGEIAVTSEKNLTEVTILIPKHAPYGRWRGLM